MIEVRRPWFCISMADLRPARCAPVEMPTPSSSLLSLIRVMSGSSSAICMTWTNQVSGRADNRVIPADLMAEKRTSEFSTETGTRSTYKRAG